MIAFASAVTYMLTIDLLPHEARDASCARPPPTRWCSMLLVAVILFVVGCFLESNAAYIMLVPLLHPIALQYGIDPLHFGFLFVFNLVIGMLTPPVGVVLFVVCGIARISLGEITRARLAVHRRDVPAAVRLHVRPAAGADAAARAGFLSHGAGSTVFRRTPRHRHDHAVRQHRGGARHHRHPARRFPRSPATSRARGVHGSSDPFPDSYDWDLMLGAARLLAHARPEVIVWSGSKAGSIAFDLDRELCDRIAAETGCRATTSTLALVDALASVAQSGSHW